MGDFEGARELLQEVLKEGDASHKEKAQAILANRRINGKEHRTPAVAPNRAAAVFFKSWMQMAHERD